MSMKQRAQTDTSRDYDAALKHLGIISAEGVPDTYFENNRDKAAKLLDQIPDRALVLELRHRKYSVSCVKRVEL